LGDDAPAGLFGAGSVGLALQGRNPPAKGAALDNLFFFMFLIRFFHFLQQIKYFSKFKLKPNASTLRFFKKHLEKLHRQQRF
jgi:hypothetical protein